MARPKKIKLRKSKNNIAKLLRITHKLAKILKATEKALKKEEDDANRVSAKKAKVPKVKAGRKTRKTRKTRKARKVIAKRGPKKRGSATRKAWTPVDIKSLRDLLTSGSSIKEVALKLKRKEGAVRQRVFQEGIKLRDLK